MTDETIPTGAYVIRNKKTSKVLHICDAHAAVIKCGQIVIHNRDEIKYRDQQIWWVERLPEREDDTAHEQGPIYSITNTASGLSLDICGAQTGNGILVHVFPIHGGYNQQWRLQGAPSASSEDERVIVSVQSGFVIGYGNPSPDSCHIWEYLPENPGQPWEFLTPVVAIPAGWVEIVNVGSGDILSQKYISSPPHLVRPPVEYGDLSSPEYRERWGTQWTLALPTTYESKGDSCGTWIIKNRLTGGRLRYPPHLHKAEYRPSVVADMNQGWLALWPLERWMLELQADSTWKIRNQQNSFYLEETELRVREGKELACVNKDFKRGDTSKMWELRKVCD